jgi:hypothetical protein
MPAERELDARYLAWLRQRLQRACDNNETITLLRKKGFSDAATRGHKIIITRWFRVHGDGPVFYV